MLATVQLRRAVDGVTLLNIPVAQPRPSSLYFIKDIEGLGPVKASIVTSEFAGMDGSLFQGARVSARNIVMNIGYRPNYSHNTNHSVQNLRRDLYNYFPTREEIFLLFVDSDDSVKTIRGYVESHEPVFFTDNPEVQISIICPEPYFEDYYTTTLESNFYENLTLGIKGSAPSGFQFNTTLNQAEDYIRLTFYPSEAEIIFRYSMRRNDNVRISTIRGSKWARVIRGGNLSTIFDGIEGSLSMELTSRTERIRARNSSGANNPYTLNYKPKYLGI